MAKYVIAIVRPSRAKVLNGLVGTSSWTRHRTYGAWTIFVHTDAAEDYFLEDISPFKGWYIDHARERLVFGTCGAEHPTPESPIEGCYVAMRLTDAELSIGNDLFCQLPLLYSSDRDILIASDSLFAVTEVRKAFGLACRLNDQVARARAWTRTLAQQNQSDMALVSDVYYCGVGSWLSVDLSRAVLDAQLHRKSVRKLFEACRESHAHTVRQAAVRMGRHISSLASAGNMVACSLSGGQDSRAVVAAASLVDQASGKIRVRSSAHSPNELRVASSLARLAGLELRRSRPPVRKSEGVSPLSRWLAHSAGIYDRLEFAPDRDPALGTFTVGGAGGELAKGMWGWWSMAWLTLAAPLRRQRALRAQCERGLSILGVSSTERWSAEWHYLGYRNAIHGGRGSARFLFHASPLMQRSLVGLAHSGLCENPAPRRGAPSIVTDLTIVLRADMAAHEYSRPMKAISRDYVRTRLRELGGPIDRRTLHPYDMCGSPDRAMIRSSPAFMERAARLEAQGDRGKPGSIALALAGAEHCPSELSHLYEPMIKWLRGCEPAAPLSLEDRVLAAKLIALNLVD